MTEQEAKEAKERADVVVEKVRALVTLEDRVIEAREAVHQLSIIHDNEAAAGQLENPIAEQQEVLAKLESELKISVEELDSITEELKWAAPCFKAYVLPQMSELVGTLKACSAAERSELAQLVTALTNEESSQTPEKLEAVIITRLKDNLERTFGT